MSDSAKSVGYAVLCVIVPIAWGLLVVQVTGFIERRLRREPHPEQVAPVAQDDRV